MKSLLIVRLGAVGDGLMLAPTLASLRRAHPSARIEIAGALWRLRLLAGPTLADAVRPIEEFFSEGRAQVHELKRFEKIVVFSIDLNDVVVREIANAAPDRVELHHSFPMGLTSKHHVIDHIQHAFAGLGIEPEADHKYCLPVPNVAREFAEEFLSGLPRRGPRVYVQAGTKIVTKQWATTRLVALCRELIGRGFQVFVGCGPLDDEIVRPLEEGLEGFPFVRARGQDLVCTSGVLARMDLCIGVDSGVTHLAALVGIPTIALHGPTRPQLWGPIGPRVHVLIGSRGLDCCTKDHPRVCEGGCMDELSVESVLAAVDKVMGGARIEGSN